MISTIAVPPLCELQMPFVACFGDKIGNTVGILAGFQMVGQLSEPLVSMTSPDGTRLVIAQMQGQLRDVDRDHDVAVFSHTHKPRIDRLKNGRLHNNPGGTSGWSIGRPTIALFEASIRTTDILDLNGSQPGQTLRGVFIICEEL